MDLGPCFGMNEHPGRDTDVISRLSKSTIEDLSFYISFTRIGSKIKDLGPCFGMNGHPRRVMDMILRLFKSTIDVLSFYECFGSLVESTWSLLTKRRTGTSRTETELNRGNSSQGRQEVRNASDSGGTPLSRRTL